MREQGGAGRRPLLATGCATPPVRDVRVVASDPDWPRAFEALAVELRGLLGGVCTAVHHIGSTSVAGLAAKPIIDILLEVTSLARLDASSHSLAANGWQVMGEYGLARRRYFRRDDADGVRGHHLHAYAAEDVEVHRHLVFRDYLRSHPHDARRYAALKMRLAAAHPTAQPTDIEAYMDGKDAFVKALEAQALAWRPT